MSAEVLVKVENISAEFDRVAKERLTVKSSNGLIGKDLNKTTLSDEALVLQTKKLVSLEAQATTNVVRAFREIFDRKLHLKAGFSSVFLMAVEEFGYDKASAQRRVNAMELSISIPWVLTAIDRKRLSLQSAADIQTFLNKERGAKRPYRVDQKIELVRACLDKSSREVQKYLASLNPQIDFKESKRFVSEDRIQVTHTLSVEIEEKLERIKALWSHVNPYMNREELLNCMAEIVLDKIDPVRKALRAEKRLEKIGELPAALMPAAQLRPAVPAQELKTFDEVVSEAGEVQIAVEFAEEEPRASESKVAKRSRYIPASVSHQVLGASAGKGCAYTSPFTHRRCGSHHQLQRDHIQPFALGGKHESANLRLLCAQHNRLRSLPS